MIGKVIKVNDYKFTYGQETMFINAYCAFKSLKSGNRYIVYSYDDKKLYYGSLFTKGDGIIIMTSKNDSSDLVKTFVDSIMTGVSNPDFESVSLEKYSDAEIIDQHEVMLDIDIMALKDKTMPKPKVVKNNKGKPKKKYVSIPALVLCFMILAVAAFLFFNPEVIVGEDIEYVCTKIYPHKDLSATVSENVNILFNGQKKLMSIDVVYDYLFTDYDYYDEFKSQSYFYQYMSDGDTYKFDDEKHLYRVFSKVNTEVDFFLPRDLDGLVKHYKDEKYTCKLVKESE